MQSPKCNPAWWSPGLIVQLRYAELRQFRIMENGWLQGLRYSLSFTVRKPSHLPLLANFGLHLFNHSNQGLSLLQQTVCNSFKISKYPTLKYGLPAAFVDGSEVKMEEYVGQRKPTDIIRWIGQQKGV